MRSAHFISAEEALAACLLANPLGAFKQLSQAMPTCARRIQVSVSKKPLYFYVNLAKARRLPPPPSVRSSPAYFCSLHVPAVQAGFLANTWCPQRLHTLCVLDQVKKVPSTSTVEHVWFMAWLHQCALSATLTSVPVCAALLGRAWRSADVSTGAWCAPPGLAEFQPFSFVIDYLLRVLSTCLCHAQRSRRSSLQLRS